LKQGAGVYKPLRYDRALQIVLHSEGGYSNHKADTGGMTMRGVTKATYDAYRDSINQPRRDVRQMTEYELSQIYLHYWFSSGAYAFRVHNPQFALVLFDMAINSGVYTAKVKRQVVGAHWKRYLDERRLFYGRLVNRNPSQRVFSQGWKNRVDRLERICAEWPKV
jgi:lysozyme family protein